MYKTFIHEYYCFLIHMVAIVFLMFILFIALSSMKAQGTSDGVKQIQNEAVEMGLAVYCPETKEFIWKRLNNYEKISFKR